MGRLGFSRSAEPGGVQSADREAIVSLKFIGSVAVISLLVTLGYDHFKGSKG